MIRLAKHRVCCLASALVFGGCSVPASDDYAVVYRSDWRNGIDPRLSMEAPNATSITTASHPPLDGVVLKVTIARGDDFRAVANGSPRAELAFAAVAAFETGVDYEVRWTTFIPADTPLDSRQPEIISQLHQGTSGGSPPFALMLDGGQYRVDIWGGEGTPTQMIQFGEPRADEGKVVRWVLHYRPDASGAGAITDLFIDGKRVVHAPGCANAYPDDTAAYWKIGIDKSGWQTRPTDVFERTVYYGDVTIRKRGK